MLIRKLSSQTTKDLLTLRNTQNEREQVLVSSKFIFFSSAGIKGVSHYHLDLFLNLSCIAQVGLSPGIKVCTTIAWPVWLTSVTALPSDLQANFLLLDHK